MRFVIALTLLAAVFCQELLITEEMTEHLRNTVDWEVEDYETNIFRGWTVEEFDQLLGYIESDESDIEPIEETSALPSEINWAGGSCDHGVKNQGNCGSCWAFAIVGMLSFRCCISGKDQGWLSPQELVSCDKADYGCRGGYLDTPMRYVQTHNGLVKEECFPYVARDVVCPSKCANGSNWRDAHVCDCRAYKSCLKTQGMKNCLKDGGPATFGFTVRNSFSYYKSGIYRCDTSAIRGGHAVTAMGYSDTPVCHYIVKNSWGAGWGDHGYFKIACDTCDIRGGVVCNNVKP